jgi:hypothetical protein
MPKRLEFKREPKKKHLTFEVKSQKFKRKKFPHFEIKIMVKKGGKEMGTITLNIGILGLLTLKNL